MLNKIFDFLKIDKEILSECIFTMFYVLSGAYFSVVFPIILFNIITYIFPALLEKNSEGIYVHVELLFKVPIFFTLFLLAVTTIESRITLKNTNKYC